MKELSELTALLFRLVAACERIAGALTTASATTTSPTRPNGKDDNPPDTFVNDRRPLGGPPKPRPQSTTADLSYVSPEVIEASRASSVQFAIDNQVVPWSEAHMKAVLDYERLVERDYGAGASEQLPWRRVVPRGEEIKHQ